MDEHEFEDRLMKLIDEARKAGVSTEAIISVLELRKMAMEEEGER